MSISLKQLPDKGGSSKPKHSDSSPGKLRELLSKEISFGSKKYSDKKKERFFSELSMLLDAGVDIRTVLEILKQEQVKEREQKLVNSIYDRLVSGCSFSEALGHTRAFGPYEIYSVQIGEETGQLAVVLQQLADYYKSRVAFKRKLVNALSYPIVILVTAIFVVLFMLNFVVPMFADIFRQSNAELPGITKGIMAISDFFRSYALILLLVIAAVILLYLRVRKREGVRKRISLFMLKRKYLGDIIRLSYLHRFCKTMALLAASGIPLLRAIQLLQKMISYYPMEKDLAKIEGDLLKGKPFSESMEGTRLFDKKMISLTRLGEETNRQEMVYQRLAAQYEQDLQQKMDILSSVLEPIVILIIGFFVAIILISMYLPMFKLGGAIGA